MKLIKKYKKFKIGDNVINVFDQRIKWGNQIVKRVRLIKDETK